MYGFRTTLHENNDLNQNSGLAAARAILSAFQRGAVEVLATSHARAGISPDLAEFWLGGPVRCTAVVVVDLPWGPNYKTLVLVS